MYTLNPIKIWGSWELRESRYPESDVIADYQLKCSKTGRVEYFDFYEDAKKFVIEQSKPDWFRQLEEKSCEIAFAL